jgi:hypothetical protein
VSARSVQILSRFPAHFEATRPDKQIAFVAAQLATHLDALATDLAGVRRSHRLAHADTARDVLLLGGLHGIGDADLDVLALKTTRLRALADALEQAIATSAAARDAAAAVLLDVFAIDPGVPRLDLFAPPPVAPGGTVDADAAARRLVQLARDAVGFHGGLEALRARVGAIARIHQNGNGTVRALLDATANALDLDLDLDRNRAVRAALLTDPAAQTELHPAVDDGLFHSRDLFWHSSFVVDRMALLPPIPGAAPLPLVDEFLGIEENPLRTETWPLPSGTPPVSSPLEVSHGFLFHVQRRGFGREVLQIAIVGVGDKTVGPMLVNRDEGRGIGWFGSVPDGQTLLLAEDGRALLDDTDVTASAYSWQGGCFALPGSTDDDLIIKRDFVFDGPGLDASEHARVARFAVALPPGALDREAAFPHGRDPVEAPGIGVGTTRLAFFVQVGHLSGDLGVTPRPLVAFAGDSANPTAPASVFAADESPAPVTAARVTLSWQEHEAYAVRVLIPGRYAKLDADGAPITARVRAALDRFRPMGVDVRVEYIDDRWVLGGGYIVGSSAFDPNMALRGGSVLWAAPPPGGS